MAMSKDIRVILVKLADRLHNMRTLKHLHRDKQERISRETMEIYAPLAHRLGISRIKWELEVMSFVTLMVEFYKISHMMKEKRREREELVDEIVDKIKTYTAEQGLVGDVYGRPKHIYSIYRKMRDKKKRFDQIYDLIAIRCVMETHSDVYAMLGYIHELSGVRCLAVSKTILPIPNPMVTSLSIQRFMDQKDLLKSKSVPRKCTKLPNTGLQLTGLTRKGSRAR